MSSCQIDSFVETKGLTGALCQYKISSINFVLGTAKYKYKVSVVFWDPFSWVISDHQCLFIAFELRLIS